MQGRTSLEPEAPPLEPRDCVFFLRGREWKRRRRSGLDFFEGAEGGEARESDFEKKKKKKQEGVEEPIIAYLLRASCFLPPRT